MTWDNVDDPFSTYSIYSHPTLLRYKNKGDSVMWMASSSSFELHTSHGDVEACIESWFWCNPCNIIFLSRHTSVNT